MTDESPNKNTLDKEYAGNINSLQLEKQSSLKYYSKENLQFEVSPYSLPLQALNFKLLSFYPENFLTKENRKLLYKMGLL